MAGDNDIGIRVTGDISDITTALSDLVSQLGEITDKVVSLVVETDTTSLTDVTTASESASTELQGVGDSAKSAGDNVKQVDSKPIKELDSSAISAADGLQTLVAAAAAIGGITLFKDLVSGAGEYEDTMDRIGVATGVGAENASAAWSDTIKSITKSTGRGAGLVRDYIISMGTMGIQSGDVIKKSFEGIAGAAYVTGKPIEQLESGFQRVVTSGNLGARQLVMLGLTTDDIFKATGMSVEEVSEKLKGMSTEGRAAFMGQILYQKYGITGNQAYMQSWQRVTDALSRAWSYLSRIVGGLILPVVIPAIEYLTGTLNSLANYINDLDPVSRGLLGGVVLLVGGFTILVTTLSGLIGLYKALNIAEGLSALKSAASLAVTDAKILANNALLLSQSAYNAILNSTILAETRDAIVKGLGVIKTVAVTAATTAAAAAQWLWNAALSANPIGIVIIAVAALAAGLYYLYQNNEQVRNSINGLWESLNGLGAWLSGGFMEALGGLAAPFQQLYDNIVGFGGDLYNAGKEWINNLIKGMQDSIPNIQTALQSIGDHFPHSPAKTGPLSEITPNSMTSYGEELGGGLATGVNQGFVKNSQQGGGFSQWFKDLQTVGQDPKNWLGGPTSILTNTMRYRQGLIDQEQKRVDAINNRVRVETAAYDNAISYIQNLDDATVGSFSEMDTAAMSFSQRMEANIQLAAHNSTAQLLSMAEVGKQAFGMLSSALDSFGLKLGEVAYSISELGMIQSYSEEGIRANIKALEQEKFGYGKWSGQYVSSSRRKAIDLEILQLEKQLDQIERITKSGGSKAGSSWSSGLAQGINKNLGLINQSASIATAGLRGRSPPKVGPLREIDRWGENIGQAFIDGMQEGIKDLNIPTPTMVGKGLGGSGDTIINLKLDKVTVGKEDEAETVGTKIATGFSKKLLGQASTAGVSVVNITRG